MITHGRKRLLRLVPPLVLLLGFFSSPALAKKPAADKEPPYDVAGLTHHRIWVPWVFAFVFTAGVLAVGFKNPHRSTTERD